MQIFYFWKKLSAWEGGGGKYENILRARINNDPYENDPGVMNMYDEMGGTATADGHIRPAVGWLGLPAFFAV